MKSLDSRPGLSDVAALRLFSSRSSTLYCRCIRAARFLRDETITQLKLHSVLPDSKETDLLLNIMPADWGEPIQAGAGQANEIESSTVEFFARTPWDDGDDGSQCVLAHDKQRDLVSIWFYFVF